MTETAHQNASSLSAGENQPLLAPPKRSRLVQLALITVMVFVVAASAGTIGFWLGWEARWATIPDREIWAPEAYQQEDDLSMLANEGSLYAQMPDTSQRNVKVGDIGFKMPLDWHYVQCTGDGVTVFMGPELPTDEVMECNFEAYGQLMITEVPMFDDSLLEPYLLEEKAIMVAGQRATWYTLKVFRGGEDTGTIMNQVVVSMPAKRKLPFMIITQPEISLGDPADSATLQKFLDSLEF